MDKTFSALYETTRGPVDAIDFADDELQVDPREEKEVDSQIVLNPFIFRA